MEKSIEKKFIRYDDKIYKPLYTLGLKYRKSMIKMGIL